MGQTPCARTSPAQSRQTHLWPQGTSTCVLGHSMQMLHSLPMPPVFDVRGERLGADAAAAAEARGEVPPADERGSPAAAVAAASCPRPAACAVSRRSAAKGSATGST